MKEAFEKIIDRLEEEVKGWLDLVSVDETVAYAEISAYNKAIKIVNQVAEEYDDKYITVPKDDFTEHLINMGYNKGLKDANNDGWIPCSERLPEVFEDTKSSDVVLVCGYDEESDYSWQAMGFYVHTEAIKRWFFAECKDTDKPIDWIDIVAWQPLPTPYKPKGEK